jgi:uncharacterized protein YecE (DUF72 family)
MKAPATGTRGTVHVGTSGFSYPEWKGSFYPDALPASQMLRHYAARFDAVEINNTFYRMPRPGVMEGWLRSVGDAFTFVVKAPMGLTNLKDRAIAAAGAKHFFGQVLALGPRFGPVLVQLPGHLKRTGAALALVEGIFALVPAGVRVALEPSDPSWHDEELYALLRAHDSALVAVDDPKKEVPLVATASWGYLRLRRAAYTKRALAAWAARLAEPPWREAFVFFKHDDEGTGPQLGARLKPLVSPAAAAR